MHIQTVFVVIVSFVILSGCSLVGSGSDKEEEERVDPIVWETDSSHLYYRNGKRKEYDPLEVVGDIVRIEYEDPNSNESPLVFYFEDSTNTKTSMIFHRGTTLKKSVLRDTYQVLECDNNASGILVPDEGNKGAGFDQVEEIKEALTAIPNGDCS